MWVGQTILLVSPLGEETIERWARLRQYVIVSEGFTDRWILSRGCDFPTILLRLVTTVMSGRFNVVKGLNEQSNCQFWKKSTYNWLVDNPSQDLFGQRSQYIMPRPKS
jgi:hypothetical protein